MRYYIEDLKNHVGKEVELKGWAYNLRGSKKIKFLILRDGTGLCQCIFFDGECDPESFNNFEKLTQECTVKVKGVVKAEPLAVVVVSLVSLSIFLVPLIALLLSFDAIVGEHER